MELWLSQALKTYQLRSWHEKFIQMYSLFSDLAAKSEQDMVFRLQKNKARLKSEVGNLEQILQIMVTDDLISREEKEVDIQCI